MSANQAFTTTLPPDLLAQLSEVAGRLSVPKNKIVEASLRAYLEEIKRQEFVKSFQRAAGDEEIMASI